MKAAALGALLVSGCYTGSSTTTTPIANETPQPKAELTISARGIGPITEDTQATAEELRRLLPDLVVEATDLGGDSGLVYEVFRGTEQLFYVVPDDAPSDDTQDQGDPHAEARYAKTIFAVFAISPRVAVQGRNWRIGAPLESATGASICECWGDGEVTACFDRGARLRVIFEDRCEDAQVQGGTAMIGKKIARVMWKVQPDPLFEDEHD
jgi:hypothetical protein